MPEADASTDVRKLTKHLALIGLRETGGEAVWLQIIKDAYVSGLLERRQYYRLRSSVKSLGQDSDLTVPSEAATELCRKVEQTAAYYH